MQSKVANDVLRTNCPDDRVKATDSFADAHVTDELAGVDAQLFVIEDCRSNKHTRDHRDDSKENVSCSKVLVDF